MQEIFNHKRGLIPGPNETKEDFLLRVNSLKLHPPHPIIFFEITPDWVPIYTKKGLPFWEGATTWIEGSHCSIQLKPTPFFYSQEEILSHELVHATRLLFNEPRFEEILAFRTSKNPLRRYFGPLFTRPFESLLFVILLLLSWILYTLDLFLAEGDLGNYALSLPAFILFFCLIRLIRSQWLFRKTLKTLTQILKKKALSAMLYLTDQEIKKFAGQSKEEIWDYIHKSPSTRLKQFSSNFLVDYTNREK